MDICKFCGGKVNEDTGICEDCGQYSDGFEETEKEEPVLMGTQRYLLDFFKKLKSDTIEGKLNWEYKDGLFMHASMLLHHKT